MSRRDSSDLFPDDGLDPEVEAELADAFGGEVLATEILADPAKLAVAVVQAAAK